MPSGRQIGAQARQRALVQEAGEIVRAIKQDFAAAEPDEQIEILTLSALDRGFACGLRQRGVGDTKRRSIAAQSGDASKSLASGARLSSVASSAYS
jgi:hypothetical protein